MQKNKSKIPLIMDTDMGPDDWFAILYLGKRNDIELKAITISGTGEAHGPKGAINCLKLLKLINKNDIPVSFGPDTPLIHDHHFPKLMRFVIDKMLFLKLPKTKKRPHSMSAVEFLNQFLINSDDKITFLATGPLTNLALLFNRYPAVKDKIAKIYLMGGAIDVAGNISSVNKSINNPHAEWNIYCDPKAANIVFQSSIPIVMVPLDATNHVLVDEEFVQFAKENNDNPISALLFRLLKRFGSRIEKGMVSLWDAVAASVIGREHVAQIEERKLIVIEDEGPESGRTKEDLQKGVLVNACMKIDKEQFVSHFFKTILQE